MNFVSEMFIVFLLVTWLTFMVIPARLRTVLLTIASYVFYATWSLPFIGVILLTTTVDYFASRFIYDNFRSRRKRKAALLVAITINLLVLGLFKYLNLFLGTNNSLLSLAGIRNPLPPHLDIILPLGISYYTFEAISYVVDVYRGGKPANNLWNYNFYIMYFPHLISGPIIRYGELRKQYNDGLQRPSPDRIALGVELIILGYIFKVAIANNAALIADPVFADPRAASSFAALLGTLAFTTQVYFDFLGYTHIARGVSLLFNIQLPLNFDHPFCATNISNFWQRWQISLSLWIRDYLFIPLGGSRAGHVRTIFNLLLIMAIAGAWHGAGWTYIVWGLF
ncbi:MAG: MBOAT family O-acyltransferase, partial [Ktedonobacteraceae bacterium]